MAKNKVMYTITTIDNPYDPFDDFTNWLMYDNDHGYDSLALLDRIAMTSDYLTDEENAETIRMAVLDIMKNDPLNVYCLATKKE